MGLWVHQKHLPLLNKESEGGKMSRAGEISLFLLNKKVHE